MATTTAAPARLDPSALARLLLLGGIWGCSFLFIKESVAGLSPAQVVAGRVGLGALTLGVVIVVRRLPLPRRPATWAHLSLVAIFANLLPFFGFAWGEQHIASGLAGIYNATTPLFTLLIAFAALPQERPSAARLTGLVLGFLGVLVVMSPWHGVAGSSLRGQLACLAAGGSYGAAIVYTRRFLSPLGLQPVVLAFSQLAAASALLVLGAPGWAGSAPSLTPRVLGSIVALGTLGTGAAYILFYGLINTVGATTASTVTYLVPIVAVTLGVLVLGERIGWNVPLGAAVVVLGIAVAEQRIGLPGTNRARLATGDSRGSSGQPG